MKPKLTAYDSKDRPTTDYGRAVGWAYEDATLPRHKGRCKERTEFLGLGANAPRWVVEAEIERKKAIDLERR